ncbi:MAG: Lrp/AsnC family transcriptional regulator [Promethearchaeota archaeon]
MSEVLKMDDIDRSILQLVQEDPNVTHTQIARKINRSQPTVGMRIKRLEKAGVLQFQAGLNMKSLDLYFAKVELQSNNPKEILDLVKKCPFIFNAFRLSGTSNISVLITNSKLQNLDNIVNIHFRNNPNILNVSMELITEVVNDFILPIDFNFKSCTCILED